MLNDEVIRELRSLDERRQRTIRQGERYPDLEIRTVEWYVIYSARSANATVDHFSVHPAPGGADLVATFWRELDDRDRIHSAPHLFVVATRSERGQAQEHPAWAEHMRAAEIPEQMIAAVAARLAKLCSARVEPSQIKETPDYLDLARLSLMVVTSADNKFLDLMTVDRAAIDDQVYRAVLRRGESLGIRLFSSDAPGPVTDACTLNARIDEFVSDLHAPPRRDADYTNAG